MLTTRAPERWVGGWVRGSVGGLRVSTASSDRGTYAPGALTDSVDGSGSIHCHTK